MSNVVCIDIGYGNVKVYDGNMVCVFPSIYMEDNRDYVLGTDNSEMLISIDGQRYSVGMSALKRGGLAPFDREDMFRHKIFMLSAICMAEKGNFEGRVALGLPIADYARMLPELKKLSGDYEVEYNGEKRAISIIEVTVYAQSESFYKLISRKDPSIGQDVVGIVDIGQKTVDFAYFDEGTYIKDRSGSADMGVINAYQTIVDAVSTKLGIPSVEDYRARKYISKVPEDSEKAFKSLAVSIKDQLYRKHWNFKELDRLYIIGGGTEYIEKYFSDAPYVKFNDAVFANVRSYMEGENK